VSLLYICAASYLFDIQLATRIVDLLSLERGYEPCKRSVTERRSLHRLHDTEHEVSNRRCLLESPETEDVLAL